MAISSSNFSIAAILIFILLTTHLNLCLAARKTTSNETETEFIKTWCNGTTNPELCFNTFSIYADEIQASPGILADKSLSLTLNATRSASKALKKLCEEKGLKPKEAEALHDCVEEIGDAVDELKRSIGEMHESEGKSFDFRMSDIKTWVSAALTNDDSCMDDFSYVATDEDVKAKVRKAIEKIAHMTSFSLTFINRYADTKG